METLSEVRCFGGTQGVYRIDSEATGTPMRFAVFAPPQPGPRPVLWFLAGLTCTEDNFMAKAGAQRVAAELGLMLVAPDTSPRGEGVADDPAYDFGMGAGFYVDATEAPWAAHFRMYSHVVDELPEIIAANTSWTHTSKLLEANCSMRSSAPTPSAARTATIWVAAAPCSIMTPFGSPVEPLV